MAEEANPLSVDPVSPDSAFRPEDRSESEINREDSETQLAIIKQTRVLTRQTAGGL